MSTGGSTRLRNNPAKVAEEAARCSELKAKGWSLRQIGAELGLSAPTVQRRISDERARRVSPQGQGKVRMWASSCGDPDRRPLPASAGSSMARTCRPSVLLLPRSERPGGSSADETTALGAVPQPAHGDIRPGQVLG